MKFPIVMLWDDFVTLNRTRRSARGFNANVMSDTAILELMRVKAHASLEIVTVTFAGTHYALRCVS